MKIVEHTPRSRCRAPLSEALRRVERDEVPPSVNLLTNRGNRSVCDDNVKSAVAHLCILVLGVQRRDELIHS